MAALLTGAILAATDPIAVISQLRSQKAPEDLTTLFEGESLFSLLVQGTTNKALIKRFSGSQV